MAAGANDGELAVVPRMTGKVFRSYCGTVDGAALQFGQEIVDDVIGPARDEPARDVKFIHCVAFPLLLDLVGDADRDANQSATDAILGINPGRAVSESGTRTGMYPIVSHLGGRVGVIVSSCGSHLVWS